MTGSGLMLGTHRLGWLARLAVSLLVSHRTLRVPLRLPRAWAESAIDSGLFTELDLFGGWQTSQAAYVNVVDSYQAEIGRLAGISPQDWVCEPAMLTTTGRTISKHWVLTIDNHCLLRQLSPSQALIPVLQGWQLRVYLVRTQEAFARPISRQSSMRYVSA